MRSAVRQGVFFCLNEQKVSFLFRSPVRRSVFYVGDVFFAFLRVVSMTDALSSLRKKTFIEKYEIFHHTWELTWLFSYGILL